MRKTFVMGIVVLLVALLAVPTAQAAPKQDFHLDAVCPSLTNLDACDIMSASAPFEQMAGGYFVYLNRVDRVNPAQYITQISRVSLFTGSGDGTAVGQVRWLTDGGRFTLGQGTGSLTGFHATGTIAITGFAPDGRVIFSLNGSYHVDP